MRKARCAKTAFLRGGKRNAFFVLLAEDMKGAKCGTPTTNRTPFFSHSKNKKYDMFNSIFSTFKYREAEEKVTTTATAKQDEGATIRRQVVPARDARTAMKVSAWFAGIRILAENCACQLLKYQRWNNVEQRYVDTEDSQTDKRLFYLLTIRPNKRMTRFEFFRNLFMRILNEGNAYVYVRYQDGKPWEMYLLTEGSVTYDKFEDHYIVADHVQKIYCDYYNRDDDGSGYVTEKVLHFRDYCVDGGYVGMPRIWYASRSLDILSTASKEMLDRFATGGRGKFIYHNNTEQGGVSFSQGNYDDNELLANGNDIQDQLWEGRDVIVTRGDGKLEPMSMSSAELQFLSSETFTIEDISRFLGVPRSRLGLTGDNSYKSMDADNLKLYTEGLHPLLESVCNEFNAKLIPWTLASSLRFYYDTSALYLADKTTEANYIIKRIQSGTMTVNEARAQMNLAPVEGGDKIVISTNLAGLDSDKINGNSNSTANTSGNGEEGGEE